MFKDFRDYLDNLEKHGLLLRVTKEVDVRYEIAAGIRKISDNNGPALLFENIKGYPGWRAVGGLFATPRLMAFALETEEKEDKLLGRYLEFDQRRIESVLVPSGPVKEVILKGNDVDLTKLPISTYCEWDAGPYLTAGVEIGRHPTTGIQNASMIRRMLLGKDKTSLAAGTPHLREMIQVAEKQGQGLGVATVIGAHPALAIASQLNAPLGVDEMEIAGALRGKPFEVVKCETIDVQVPADAEIVIEGVTVPGESATDGPFGEYPGNYVTMHNWFVSPGEARHDVYLVKVTAITMRKGAIFQAMLTGMPTTENQILKKWAMAADAYRILNRLVPYPEDIHGVNLTAASGGYHLVVSIHKRAEATARNIIYTILVSGMPIGHVVVVDDDINSYDPAEVEWAVATRVRADRDVIILPPLAPEPGAAANLPTHMYKWGIDATAPLMKEPWLYKRAIPPGVSEVDYV